MQNCFWNLVFRIISFSLLLLTLGFPAAAQQRQKAGRIGVLGAAEEPRFSEVLAGLKQGFSELGYPAQAIEIFAERIPRGDRSGERKAVERLVQQRVQVLFAIGSRLVRVTRQVSAELPIVFITPGDPVSSGLVSSLARPGAGTTGMTFEYPELSGKRLELLREIDPGIRRILTLYDPRDDSPKQGLMAAKDVAPKLGLTLLARETRSREEISQALSMLGEADAFLAIPGGQPTAHYKEIIHATNAKRLPNIFHARTGSTLEALASYGANDSEIARQAARIVDKILNGTNAGNIPIERPIKIQFILNLRTAKEIGLTIPANVLARADRVIR